MSLQGDPLPAPVVSDESIEQVLLGLADGSYVLSTPDGAVAECGVGVVGLLGAPADRLVGRPTAEVLVPGADDAVRHAFDQLLLADGADVAAPRTFRAQTPGGATRSLQFVVVAVPLALGWEFTSLLSELGSRDAGTWHPEALRMRHGRALEAIEGVVRDGPQPDPSARLAGILIVVRDVDAPALTREDVDRRMADQREAARVAAAEAARRKDEAAGRAGHGTDAKTVNQLPGLEDLVERARVLRERLEEAEHDAAAAKIERDEALGKLAHARGRARCRERARRQRAGRRRGSCRAADKRARRVTHAHGGVAPRARRRARRGRARTRRRSQCASRGRRRPRGGRGRSGRGRLRPRRGAGRPRRGPVGGAPPRRPPRPTHSPPAPTRSPRAPKPSRRVPRPRPPAATPRHPRTPPAPRPSPSVPG